jgi:micrococcal nuclease
MPLQSKNKLINLLLSIIVVILVSYFGNGTDTLGSFQSNFEKSYYFDSCSLSDTATSTNVFHIVQVIDGDTVEISKDCKAVRVRFIGINTPETVDARKPVECFGKEASDHAKHILSNKDVEIEADPTQGTYDKYGRLLGYVILPDGTNFNKIMIEQGYAYEDTYDKPYQYQAEFRQAQDDAKQNQRGLWSPSTCNGKK